MKSQCLSLIVLTAALCGCATDDTVKTTSSVYSPTDPLTVRVFEGAPLGAYEVIGKVKDTEIYVPNSTMGLAVDQRVNVVDELRKKAAAIGADGLIITTRHVIPPALPLSGASKDNPVNTKLEVTGLAIRLKPDAKSS